MAHRSRTKKNAVVKDPEHCGRVVRSLQSFNNQQTYTDLCFVCARGLKVYAHKLLVCSVSTQLKEIILQLPDNLSKITVHVPDVASRILQMIIALLYEGNVRVSRQDYERFKDTMNFLGIVLEPPGNKTNDDDDDDVVMTEETPSQPPVTPTRAPQMLYLGNPSNSPVGVQYVLAPSSMVQGSQPSPNVQPANATVSHIPASTSQVQPGNQILQLVQSQGGQMVPFSGQMVQTINGQMVQAVSMMQPVTQTVHSSNNQMILPDNQMAHQVNSQNTHTVQAANNQMMVQDSQMITGVNNRMLNPGGNQMGQQTAQMVTNGTPMVVHNNRHTIINTTHTTQLNLQNQPDGRKLPLSSNLVRKRTINRVRQIGSTSAQQPVSNPNSAQDGTLVRRRTSGPMAVVRRRLTGPVVTGVHSMAGNSIRPMNVGGRTGPSTSVVQRSQDPFA